MKVYCRHHHTIESHPNCFFRPPHKRAGEVREPGNWWDGLKIGFLDIETSDLNADGFTSMMLSWYIKVEGQDKFESDCIKPSEICSPAKHDRRIVKSLVEVLRSKRYDVISTYFGTNFDNKFVRTRAMMHNISFPVYGELLHLDLYYSAKKNMKLGSYRLESVCDALGIEGKTKLVWSTWRRAMQGDEKALGYIYEHNMYDVDILDQVFHRMKSFIKFTKRSI